MSRDCLTSDQWSAINIYKDLPDALLRTHTQIVLCRQSSNMELRGIMTSDIAAKPQHCM